MGGTKNGQRIETKTPVQPAGSIEVGTEAKRKASRPALLLFALALAADLLFILIDAPDWRLLSKPLIVPGLLLYFATSVKLKPSWQRTVFAALIFSWIGDVLLLFEDRATVYFMLGLATFLIAHIFYCVFLFRIWKAERLRLHPTFVVGVLVYYAGLLLLLWPHLGDLKIPVLVYGAVISTMLLLALHTVLLRQGAARLLMPGAVLFVLSDSVLALNRFLQPLPMAGIVVMLTYGFAQLLLVTGAIAYLKPR